MKYSNKKSNIKITIFLICILVFVGGALFDFYSRIQQRILELQLDVDAEILLGNDIYMLIWKIIIAVILLCGIIVYYTNKEKKQYMHEIDEKKKSEKELKEKADRDYLTGLFNRRSGEEQVERFLEKEAENSEVCHAFIIMDLDNFKLLNDTFGHQIGDLALKEVADVLYRHFHAEDIIYRLGGDEFAVLMKNIPIHIIPKNMQVLLGKILKIYEQKDKAVTLSASVGIALWPAHGEKLKELYKKADYALYHVKKKGKASFEIYKEHQEGDI
ncbi:MULTISPECIES: GGDEF domain-containing protein [Anaerostipes]|uniref:GGDEF domain-containing protein n=1 Tax=Anaerostipes TaxID=207244 RepID=UPI0009528876|nr:GGDEF domain-containing protein [Anaerostipes sp. 494a]OLR59573.1 hypothetical protein BHF70_08110 [Anaerostipes sp. 494a]